MSHRRVVGMLGAGEWTPPEVDSLAAAWVQGLSGAVAKLGTWAGQYGTSLAAALKGDAQVTANGLELDGTGDWAVVTDDGSLDAANFTIALWLKTTATSGAIATNYRTTDDPPYNGVGFALVSSNLNLFLGDVPKSFENIDSGLTRASGEWQFCVARRNGNAIAFWLNGTKATKTGTITPNFTTASPFLGAYSPGVTLVTGAMDCIYWYGAAISDDSVADLYNNDPNRRGNL